MHNSSTFALIRSYNRPQVVDQVLSLGDSGIVDAVVVVINKLRDSIATHDLLCKLPCKCSIIPVVLEQFGWSRALNAGIAALPQRSHENEFVLSISVEVETRPDQLKLLLAEAQKTNVSCAYALFEGRLERSYRVPRNTCCLWNRRVFETVGVFDERWDGETGMEDYHLALEAFAQKQWLPRCAVRDANVKIPDDFASKLDWENRGLARIDALYSSSLVAQFWRRLETERLAKAEISV